MRKFNQKGFTFIEGLLIIIALSLVIGVGYYIMNAGKDNEEKPVISTQNPDTNTTKPAVTAKKEYLAITELGIKLPLSASLKDAKYELNPAQDSWAGVTTTGFADAVAACRAADTASASFPAIGEIAKYEGIYNSKAKPNDAYMEFVKQFPGFYLEYGRGDGSLCSGSDATKDAATKALFDKLAPELKTAIQQAETL